MLIKKLKQIIQTASILGFIWGANVVAAPVEPFYFQGATNQQDMWDSLMRYKMFGQTGINFGNQDINVTDKVGWFGTNNGDLTLANDKHVVGGPILIGGNIILGTGRLDFTTGPVRVTGRIDSKDGKSDGFANGPNFANGVHCVQGSVFDKYDQAILGDKYIGSSNYRNCPEDVPGINPNLKIPTVSQPDKNKMNIKNDLLLNSKGEKVIEIPVRKSGEPEIYDIYVPNGISLKNGASIIIKMPEGGRLTRIFSESIIFDGGSSIRVQHGNKILEKEDYAGDLLFYINSTISFAALHPEDKLQGSFISTDTIKIMQHMDLAGQLIAKYLTIDAHFEGDGFRYVPFDPPILEINREALAYGSFFEGSEWQEVPIKLDSIPRTDVIFNYCFEFTSNKAAADSADFFENAKGMPICGRDSGEVTILEGKTKPEGKNIVSIYPILDAKPEGLEYFNIKIFNIYGAVLPGNKKSDFFELSINDANPIPQDASVTGEEDKNLYFSSKNFPYTTTDTSGEDTLEVLKIISLPSKGSLYINGDTVKVNQEILAKDIDSLYFLGEKDEFGSPYTSFKFNVQTKWGTGEKPATMTVNLTAVNDAPTIAAGQSFNIEENKSVNSTVGTVKAIDVDGDTLTFKVLGFTALKADSTADTITVDYFNFNSSGLITTKVVLDFETMPHLYRYQVEVSDGELTDTAFVYINLLDVNEAPIVKNAEFDIEENDNPNKVLGSIEASDVDAADTVLSYSISGEDSQYFKIDAKTGQLSVNNTVFDYEDSIPNVFTFSVIVTDNVLGSAKSTLSDTATVTVTVLDVNDAPTVEGAEFDIEENNNPNLILDTIKASDVDSGTVLTYSISGEGSEHFVIDATTGQLSVNNTVFDYEDSKPNVFTFTVTVTDNGLQGKGQTLSATASIKITIIDTPEAPKFTQDKYEFDVEEEHGNNVLVGQVEATDEDTEKSKLTYKILSSIVTNEGKLVDYFVIDSKTGEIRVKPGLILDYETHDHFYTLKVSVSDGALFDTTTVLIELIDINEAPIVKGAEFEIDENNNPNLNLGNIEASDVDAGTVLTYSISGEGSEHFVIDATTGQLSVNNTVFDYEDSKPNVFTFTVTVTDNGLQGEGDFLSTSAIVKVTVKDVNEAPELADVTFDVDENSPAGTVVGLLEAFDPDANDVLKYSILEGNTGSIFVLNATTGLITVRNSNSLNYEEMENHKFELIVRVVDKGGLADTAKVTIVVNDINDAPVIAAGQKFEIFENNKNEAIVGEIHVSDEDGDVLTFDFLSLNAGTKAVDYFDLYTDGTIRVKSGLQLDYETMPHVYELKFSVSDGDTTITGSVAIHLLDLNEAPVVDDQNFGIEENSPAGALVGVIQASDPDKVASFNTLSYKVLSGNEAELFVIDSKTGKITVRKSNSLDYETMPHLYLLTVEVSDGELQDTATISIDLLDVNDPPTVEDLETNIDENVPYGTVIDTVIAHDEDTPDLEYSFVKDPASESFSIDNNGVITVNGPLDYETRNEYIVKVVVFDGDSRDTALVIIRINNVNEAPVIENQAFSAKEDISSKHRIGVVQYKDPENDPLVFTIIQDTSSLFRITPSGEIYLKDGASLDYEKTTEYVIQVKGVDPGGLMDSAYVTINVLDVFEKTEVEIVVVVTTDSIHSYPDTVYTNSSYVELEWDVDGNRFYGDTLLEKGKNVIIKKYCDLSKNECGLDTVVIFYSNESPKVDLSLKVGEKEKVSGVTIVEEKDKKDSLNYINKEKNQLVVTVKDPSPDGGTTVNRFEIEAQLKTINVPSSVFDDLSVISKNWQFEPKKEKVEITVDGRTKLKYETKVKGYSVTVVYDPAKDSSTAKVIYTAIVNGEKVEVSFKADRDTGKLIKDDGGSYAVTYSYKDKRNNTMLISYPVNSSGKVVKTKEEGGVIYTVGYSYTNAYGNTAIQSTKILLDTIPPVVQIIDPVEGVTISSVSVDVKWTVDGIVQDTLNLQGLEKGVNRIIRAYRDKAGNETADTVYVIMKGAKDIVVKIENPMIEITKKKLDQFKDGLDDDALYRVSILNPSTNLEQELIVGTKGGNKKGSNDEPYPYLSGSHLGPTLEIDVKMPSLNPTGGLASLADLVESDGMIALESGGGWDRKKVTVQEYVSSYCSAEFQKDFDINDPSATPLYKVDFGMSVWVYTSLGSFVEKYTVNPKINSRELVNVAGVAKLFFEVVPNRDGVLIDKRGRLWGTGAYLYKTDIKMHFEQQCALPSSKMGSKRKTEDQTLSSFGYKRIPIK